ncbi:hypothetical protein MNBD_GAMMA21-2123 [hydrothermal vent metagenome]|uniref:Uncharacterized protein n=1 Tax=hydrothermal vent metagenome TaxID=652676 RepID=A0A3B1AKP9_9ZZZZ
MDNKIFSIDRRASTENSRATIAEVIEVEHFEATNIYLPNLNKEVNVYAHSSSVPELSVGDMVLVEYIDTLYIITHRLRSKGEAPQQGFALNDDGSLQVKNADGILIQSNASKIEIQKDGRIMVDGKEIYSIADGKHRLQGAIVELN